VTDRQRILLAELEPNIPADPIYATWSPTDRHPDIALSGGNLVASKSTTSATAWACAAATTPLRLGRWYWEVSLSFTGTADAMLGLRRPFGDQAEWQAIIGVNRAGQLRMYGSVIGSLGGALTSGDVVRFCYDADINQLRIARNGGAWVSLAPGLFVVDPVASIFPAVGILRPTGTSCVITANFGATPHQYPVPEGCNRGVYTVPAPTRTSVYLSNTGYKTGAGETPASTYYDGRIAGDSDVEFTREIGLSPWGNTAAARGGELSVINRDGGVDEWLAWEWRDAPFRLYSGYEGDPRAAFQLWSEGVVDRVEGVDSRRLRIVLADPLARVDVPVQSELYPDDAPNAQLRGKPLPIVLGRPRWCEPQRQDTSPAIRDYRLHGHGKSAVDDSAGIDAISDAFDGGDRFGGPSDPYTPTSTVTAANGGNLVTWAGTPARPTGWNDSSAMDSPAGRFTTLGALTPGARCESSGEIACWMSHSAAVPVGRHVVTFNVGAVTTQGTLYVSVGTRIVGVPITTTGAKQAVIDVDAPGGRLTLGMGPMLGMPGSRLDCTINTLRMSSQQIVDWTYYSDGSDRVGLTLAHTPWGRITCHPVGPTVRSGAAVLERAYHIWDWIFARLAEDRGIYIQTSGDLPSLEQRMATYLTQPVTYAAVLRQLADSVLAGVWTSRTGEVRSARWMEPDPSAVVLTLDERNIAGDIRIELDQAKSLRRRVAGRRNHAVHSDSEIAGSVSEALREELKSEWGFTANGAGAAEGDDRPLSAAYLAASDRDPLPTLLQDDADITALANALCSLWRPTRYFYDVTAVLDADAADTLEPGQTVRLVWSRIAGLAGGIPLRVVRVRSRYLSRRVDLRLWGSAPPITASSGRGRDRQ